MKHSTSLPNAFTEKGLYMLATIMKGDIAIEATLAIIDTFTMTRQLARTMESLQNVEDGGEQQQQNENNEKERKYLITTTGKPTTKPSKLM